MWIVVSFPVIDSTRQHGVGGSVEAEVVGATVVGTEVVGARVVTLLTKVLNSASLPAELQPVRRTLMPLTAAEDCDEHDK